MIATIASPLLWTVFGAVVLGLLALDLGVFHRKAHAVTFKESLIWSIVWIGLGLAFGGFITYDHGWGRGAEYLTGYVIEKALSIDNIFIFIIIFRTFSVPSEYQHRVLFWGILSALIFRAIFVAAGASLLAAFHGVIYIFGAILILTGIKLLLQRNSEPDPSNNMIVRAFRRAVPMTSGFVGERFLVREGGRWLATPLLLVLCVVEFTDIIFAVDSIPAIFAVTDDAFIVFTSNVFAILGLRSLFFLLAGVLSKFRYLKVGLSLVLVFVGLKMVAADFVKIPPALSLVIVCAILGASMLASLRAPARNHEAV